MRGEEGTEIEKRLMGGQDGGIISTADHQGDDGGAEVVDELGARSFSFGILLGEGQLPASVLLLSGLLRHLDIDSGGLLGNLLGVVGHDERCCLVVFGMEGR